MRVEIVVNGAAFDKPSWFANWVQMQLVTMVAVNRILVRKGLVGPLYASGIRYRKEPPGVESFVDALTCKRAGHGDCAHLACWLCAELQERGIRSSIRVKWNHPLFHVQVRMPDGSIRDPSRDLGMGRVAA